MATPSSVRAGKTIAKAGSGNLFTVNTKAFDVFFSIESAKTMHPMYAGHMILVKRALHALTRDTVRAIQQDMIKKDAVFTGTLLRKVGSSPRIYADRSNSTYGFLLDIRSSYAATWDSDDMGQGFRPNAPRYISEAKIGRWKKYRGITKGGKGLWVGRTSASKKRWISDPVAKMENEIFLRSSSILSNVAIGLHAGF